MHGVQKGVYINVVVAFTHALKQMNDDQLLRRNSRQSSRKLNTKIQMCSWYIFSNLARVTILLRLDCNSGWKKDICLFSLSINLPKIFYWLISLQLTFKRLETVLVTDSLLIYHQNEDTNHTVNTVKLILFLCFKFLQISQWYCYPEFVWFVEPSSENLASWEN